eukprot:g1268.t1
MVQKFDVNGRVSGLVGREVNGTQQRFRGYWFATEDLNKPAEPKDGDNSKRGIFSRLSMKKQGEKRPVKQARNMDLDDINEIHIDLSHLSTRFSLPEEVVAEASQHVELEWIKDLSMLNCPLSRTVLIDDWAELMIFNPHNAIVIPEYRFPDRQTNDNALEQIYEVLRSFAHPQVDVRHHLQDESMSHLSALVDLHLAHRAHCERHRPWVGPYNTIGLRSEQDVEGYEQVMEQQQLENQMSNLQILA